MISSITGGQDGFRRPSATFSVRSMGAKLASMLTRSSDVQQQTFEAPISIVRPASPVPVLAPEKIVITSPVLRPSPRPSPLPSPVISCQVSPNVSRRPSPRRSFASAPRSRAVSEEFVLDGAEELAQPDMPFPTKQRALTDTTLGLSESPMHLAAVLSQETSTLTVIGQRICVQGPDGRRIVVFQKDSDNTKQVKMLQQICSAVQSLAPEAWQQEEAVKPRPQVCRCCICMDEHSWGDGLECAPNGHFVCNSCFETYVKTQCALGSKGASAEDGSLYCPGRCEKASSSGCIESVRCSATFDSHAVARHIGREAFECYWSYRSRLAEERIAAEMEEALRARAEAEKRLGLVSRARSELAEILTLKCPRCDQAFNDFQGCFALQCARDKCKACFCGWCMKDCGNNPDAAHRHVCFECVTGRQRSPKDPLFGTEAMFESVCQERRLKLLKEHLEKLDPNLRNEVLEMAKSELASLGLAGAAAPREISTAAPSQVIPQPTNRFVQSAKVQESARVAASPAPPPIHRSPNAQHSVPLQAKAPSIVQSRSSPTSLQLPQQPPRKQAQTLPSAAVRPSSDISSGISGTQKLGAQFGNRAMPIDQLRAQQRSPMAIRAASIVQPARR